MRSSASKGGGDPDARAAPPTKQDERPRNPKTTLWMGDLERDMGEAEIMAAFQSQGFKPSLIRVIQKVSRGQEASAGYCFITFDTVDEAKRALDHLNGEPIPKTHPVRVFYLNWACQQNKAQIFNVYIGRLPQSVDSYQLMRQFRKHFASCHGAKVIYDRSGMVSRGFGFLRFSNREDANMCIKRFNQTELFGKIITLSVAFPTRAKMRHEGARPMPGPLNLRGMSPHAAGPASAPATYAHMQPRFEYPVTYQPSMGHVPTMPSPYPQVYMASPTQGWQSFSFDGPYASAQLPVQGTPPMYSASYPVQPSSPTDYGMAALTDQMAQHSLGSSMQGPPVPHQHHHPMYMYASSQQQPMGVLRPPYMYRAPGWEGREESQGAPVPITRMQDFPGQPGSDDNRSE